MANNPLKLLRYNTGNDKKVFVKFKDNFDSVIFNATIVAHSGSAIADLVSIHKNQFIIDPQTHIFQHEIAALKSPRSKNNSIKASIVKYLKKLPPELSNITIKESRPLLPSDIEPRIEKLVRTVTEFQTSFVNEFIKEKEYDQYLEFVGLKPNPKILIAPYFMLKNEYSDTQNEEWIKLNRACLHSFIEKNKGFPNIAAQIVIDKDILKNDYLREKVVQTYDLNGYEYIFVWIDEFSSFHSGTESKKAFRKFLHELNSINKKVIMAYGGYDSILLCNSNVKDRMYGVAQSIGYGESRSITPVGGGFPINKYYFFPTHQRMKFDEVAGILLNNNYFNNSVLNSERVLNFIRDICDCEQCKQIIKNDINNFNLFSESKVFTINSRHGTISRNRPTTDAEFISAMHFMYCKVKEWRDIKKRNFNELISELDRNYSLYSTDSEKNKIARWIEIYGE